MGAISLVSYQVKPGRTEDFLTAMREAKCVIEGLAVNLQSIRAYRVAVGGPNTGRLHVEFTYGDVSDWGETFVKEANDPGFNELVARASGPDSPAELIGRGIQTEIGPSAGTETGSVMIAAIGKLKPGRMSDYLGQITNINELLIAHGAVRVRHVTMSVAGPLTGHVAALAEYQDMAGLGDAWVSEDDDPAWNELLDSVVGPDGPIIEESQVILTELPL